MAKRKFYALTRYIDTTDGKKKAGYMPKEGEVVPNNLGYNLIVYRTTDCPSNEPKPIKVWFVVDESCGLAVGKGDTKNKAIANALENLTKVDKDKYESKRAGAIEMYGPVPGHEVMYLH